MLPSLPEDFVDSLGLDAGGGQLGKDPDLARSVAERVVLRTKDVRQAIQVAKLCDSPEEMAGVYHVQLKYAHPGGKQDTEERTKGLDLTHEAIQKARGQQGGPVMQNPLLPPPPARSTP